MEKNVLLDIDQREVAYSHPLNNTDYFIEKGDYIKINNISIGYSIPFLTKNIKSAKIYLAK
jgi:hypothetical protein